MFEYHNSIIGPDDRILVTGATGFIGRRLIKILLERGFREVRMFARPSSDVAKLEAILTNYRGQARVEMIKGNLLSRDDCIAATEGVAVIFHLATGGGNSFPDAFMNSVVTTRNVLDSSLQSKCLRRFVNISSFAVYANTQRKELNERSPVEEHPESCGDAYSFAKVKQDQIVTEYGIRFGLPYVIVRPGSVYGPDKASITGRVGVDTFGVFLHLGTSSQIPLTYVDNCAEAIVLAGVREGVDGEVFNVVDDNLPSSRTFLRQYKRNVQNFRSIYVPHFASYGLCWLWEKYSAWSEGQLPPAFNRRRWRVEWKKTRFSNEKVKAKLGWAPEISMTEGLRRYFEGCREDFNA